MPDVAYQVCINSDCRREYGAEEALSSCESCGSLLDVEYRWEKVKLPSSLSWFEKRWPRRRDALDFSGVWRFRELLPFARPQDVTTIGEGQTFLHPGGAICRYVGVRDGRLFLQYEGMNPSGSFKDNGMTAAFTHAQMVGARRAACASTGNTAASMSLYASCTGALEVILFVGRGKIAEGKLSQILDTGARVIQILGDFDDAMASVQSTAVSENLYIMNSVNPFRLEGQKAIMYRVLESLAWQPPDWIVVPGGNLGNSSAFGKAFDELRKLELIKKVPRIAVVNAEGAPTFYKLAKERGLSWNDGRVDREAIRRYYEGLDEKGVRAKTVASAIEINRPVNLCKALRALAVMGGTVCTVTDDEILDAKAQVGAHGMGCEAASGAAVAGAKKLVADGVISPGEVVVCILTGNRLKDPLVTLKYHGGAVMREPDALKDYDASHARHANRPILVPNDIEAIRAAVRGERPQGGKEK